MLRQFSRKILLVMFDYEEAHYVYVFDKLMEERSN